MRKATPEPHIDCQGVDCHQDLSAYAGRVGGPPDIVVRAEAPVAHVTYRI